MELAPNGELFTYMKNECRVEYLQAQFLAAEIVNMIEYLQTRRISHRDIKPANLLFDNKMRLKLVDFGSGKFFKNSDETLEERTDTNRQSGGKDDKVLKRKNTLVGTFEYMSPEIIKGTCTKNE